LSTKLEHFKKLQGNLEFHQNKCHPGNVPDTRQCANATDQWAQGVAGRPNPWLVSPTLQPLVGRLHGDTLQEAVTVNPKSKVSGGWTLWLPDHVDRPADHHLVSYRLNQVSNPSLDTYKYPPTGGNQHTTLYLLFSTCKGFGLVVVA
jgi:hypothetical protein